MRQRPWLVFWLCAAVLTWWWSAGGAAWWPEWAGRYPRAWTYGLNRDINGFMDWLVNQASLGLFTVREATRGLAWLMDVPLTAATGLLAEGVTTGQGSASVQWLPPLPWLAVVLGVAALGHYARDWKLAVLAGGCFLYLAVFGQWQSAMVTLASIVIAVPFGVAGGLAMGVAGYRYRWLERLLTPLLDLMQTVPVFAYLLPILFLFGFGPVAAMLATIIYAMPPMTRVTWLALRAVPPEILDFGNMAGCTRRQLLWKVHLPSALPALMVGVNQVIMLSLNMVIIASMIGAGGLGYDVLAALRRLDIGAGLEAGLAIVMLAVALDRLSQALAHKPQRLAAVQQRGWRRYPRLSVFAAATLGLGLLGMAWAPAQHYPTSWQITTGPLMADLVAWINIHFFDALEAARTGLLLHVLVPVKRFLFALPWPWVVALLAIAGWRLGGWRLAATCTLLAAFILVNGQWRNAMETVYLCGISVIIAMLIGLPLGVLGARSERAWRVTQGVVDTLQTLPSFVYLIPVVMLFRVGDFSAMVAVVLYALAPAIRYTAEGLRRIDAQLIEAGTVSGCTPRQLLWKIRLPLALPSVLLGLNQTIMLALSMLVITALVGTRDLGQEVYIALTKADTGRGIVAGLCVAAIAITADRLIGAGTRRLRHRLGLTDQESTP